MTASNARYVLTLLLLCIGFGNGGKVKSIQPSGVWEGNDGLWSTFMVEIGSPPQKTRVLPSTSISALLVVEPEGCDTSTDPNDCSERRGGFFDSDRSSTWLQKSILELPIAVEKPWGYSGNGSYGFDMIRFQDLEGDNLTLPEGIVSAYATKDFFLGFLGLTQHNLYVGDFNSTPIPSIFAQLTEIGEVGSLSWGYTAGASYTPNPTVGSLTLGGYDASRLIANNLTLAILDDPKRELVLGLQAITSDSQNLLMESVSVMLDSTIAQIWLPEAACLRFEEVFGLVWDDQTNLYFVNDSLHQTLLEEKPVITFTIGENTTSGEIVNINMPYAAFDMQAAWPLSSGSPERYFPLRRASDPSLYVLGRPFFQEAYVTVDYGRGNFSVSQAKFPTAEAEAELVEIEPPSTKPKDGDKLGGGAIAGIVLAVLAVLLIIAAAILWRHRRRALQSQTHDGLSGSAEGTELKPELPAHSIVAKSCAVSKAELAGDSAEAVPLTNSESTTISLWSHHSPRSELDNGVGGSASDRAELYGGGGTSGELAGTPVVAELDSARRLPEKSRTQAVYELP